MKKKRGMKKGAQVLKKKDLLIVHEEALFFCVRSTPLRRLGGGFCGTYNPVPGVSQNAPIHLAKLGE